MPDNRHNAPRSARSSTGSLITIVLVFAFASIVVLAILLGAFFVAISVTALAIPAALVARLMQARRRRSRDEQNS
jgi:uncharacterized membrane protein YoaK (UPF0700 family)